MSWSAGTRRIFGTIPGAGLTASANSVLLGSGAAGTGLPYGPITLGANLSMSGTTLNASGGGGSGTVTSVAVAVPTILTVSGSPVTTAGTITLALSTGAGAIMGQLLEEHTASSSATLDFTTAITSAYDIYQFEFINIIPATNGALFNMRVSTDGGSTYDAGANYGWASWRWLSSGSGTQGANSGASAITLVSTINHDHERQLEREWKTHTL